MTVVSMHHTKISVGGGGGRLESFWPIQLINPCSFVTVKI